MIAVKRYRTTQTLDDMEPHWLAVIDYSGHEVTIPLPGRLLSGDSIQQQRLEVAQAMERLAGALQDFAAKLRT